MQNILVVDDLPEADVLKKFNLNIFQAVSVDNAVEMMRENEFTFVILKVSLLLEMQKEKVFHNKTLLELEQALDELDRVNQILRDQKKLEDEKEWLKLLFQMAEASAYELGQPLTVLMGNIDLLNLENSLPENLRQRLSRVKEAGYNLSKIVKKIQSIHQKQANRKFKDAASIINEEIKILLVEDSATNMESIRNALKNHSRIMLFRAKGIDEVLKMVRQAEFDLIILDKAFSKENGMRFLRIMEQGNSDLPIAVLTDQVEAVLASHLIQAGAYDCLSSDNINEESLLPFLTNSLQKAHLKREIRLAYEKMADLSSRDELTGFYNRRAFIKSLDAEISRARRYQTDLSVFFISLDDLKEISVSDGLLSGDKVLSGIAKIINENTRVSDLKCRYGDEELAVLLPNTDENTGQAVVDKIKRMVNAHLFEIKGRKLNVNISIGSSALAKNESVSHESVSAEKMINDAKQALLSVGATCNGKP